MKTAVEWMIEELRNDIIGHVSDVKLHVLIEAALAMEKDNIIDAWDDGYDKGTRDRIEKISNPVGNAEQYYNETFKSE